MLTACLTLMIAGFVICWPGVWVCRRMAKWLGQVDKPGERKIHVEPTPVTGGIAIFWAMVLPMLVLLAGAWWAPESWWRRLAPDAMIYLQGVRETTKLAFGFLACLGGLHLVGIVDDRVNLGPFVKMVVQLAAAGVMAMGFDVRVLEMLGPTGSIVVTVLWFTAITNAFNFMDNMDGLSAGVATIGAGIFLAAAVLGGQWFVAGVLALLIGALVAFLCFNFPPASIFMGDGGSLVIGFTLAFCALRLTYVELPPGAIEHEQARWWALLTPVVVLAIPLYDLTSVTLLRLRQGRSPFRGDTQHFSHRLVRRGLSRPAAVGVIYACTLATGLGGVMLGRVTQWQAGVIFAQTLAIVLVVGLMERGGVRKEDL